MKFYSVLCAVALVLQVCLGAVLLPEPENSSELAEQSVSSSEPTALPEIAAPELPTPVPTIAPATIPPATPDVAEQAIESMPCNNLEDIEHIVSTKVTKPIDEGGILSDWFPDDILTNLNGTVFTAHSKLIDDVMMIVNITSEFNNELDKAVEIAGARIGIETERIDADERMTALFKTVPSAFTDTNVVSETCKIVKKAAVSAHVLQDGLFACEKALKYGIIPNVDKITEDLETLSTKIFSISKESGDDSSILPLMNEIRSLYATVENALAADKDMVTNAGLALTKCVVDLINTAKKETDSDYNDIKKFVPEEMIMGALKKLQTTTPAPVFQASVEPGAVPVVEPAAVPVVEPATQFPVPPTPLPAIPVA